MSWIRSPTALHVMTHRGHEVYDQLYVGFGVDKGLFCFKPRWYQFPVVSTFANIVPRLVVGSYTLTCQYGHAVNGFCLYSTSDSEWNSWYSANYGWIMCASAVPVGSDPVEATTTTSSGATKYVGDKFYVLNDFGIYVINTGSGTAVPRGSLRGGDSLTHRLLFYGYMPTNNGIYTTYSQVPSGTGKKTLGSWTFSLRGGLTGSVYRKLPDSTSTETTYVPFTIAGYEGTNKDTIHYVDGEWIIGDKNDTYQYYSSSSAPSKTETVTYKWKACSGTDLAKAVQEYEASLPVLEAANEAYATANNAYNEAFAALNAAHDAFDAATAALEEAIASGASDEEIEACRTARRKAMVASAEAYTACKAAEETMSTAEAAAAEAAANTVALKEKVETMDPNGSKREAMAKARSEHPDVTIVYSGLWNPGAKKTVYVGSVASWQ